MTDTAAPADTTPATPADPVDVERGDEEFRTWMRGHLTRAANAFDVAVTGDPVFGWCLRSISAPVHCRRGTRYWLRVGTERDTDLAHPDTQVMWNGLTDANTITGIPKPTVVASTHWPEPAHQRQVRADLQTFLPGQPVSPTDELTEDPDLPESWWTALRTTLDTLAATPTTRFVRTPSIDQQAPSGRVRDIFGDRIATAARPTSWATVHGDLHWSNILAPQFCLLDWELWGHGQTGLDAATLYLFSLQAPRVNAHVRAVFTDILDSSHGHRAQIAVASRIFMRTRDGFYSELAPLVQRQIEPICTAFGNLG